MAKLVTIAIPVYKRLEYLPHVLDIVRSQDYPALELIVSDNGMNACSVREIVDQHYPKQYKFRQNACTVDVSTHFNQLIAEASGDYFVLLCDDDEISPNYISELVSVLDRHPQATVALSRQEIMDENGAILRGSKDPLPTIMSGADFIRAAWGTYEYKFECFNTFLSRTESLRACGGFPDFARGHGVDNALLIKLCLLGQIALSSRCTSRWRVHMSSFGWSMNLPDIAEATKHFMQFLDADPIIRAFASRSPAQWKQMNSCLVKMAWNTYFFRWRDLYRYRMSNLQWIRAGFALPFIAAYYLAVTFTLAKVSKAAAFARGRKWVSWAIRV